MALTRLTFGVLVLSLSSLVIAAPSPITGGTLATEDQVPYIVSIQNQPGDLVAHTCGGTLLDGFTVLTAAHCVTRAPDTYVIKAGILDLSLETDQTKVSSIREVILHPEYDPDNFLFDVAIVKLSTEIAPNRLIQFAKLVEDEDGPRHPAELTFSGWGITALQAPTSRNLQTVKLIVNSKSACDKVGYAGTDHMSCAGFDGQSTPAQGVCSGDSGGPVSSAAALGRLVGVVSRGSCQGMSIFVTIAAVKSFIDQHLGA